MPPEIRYASVNGARLGYEVHSEGSGKPPAIFVHGYSGRTTGGESYPEFVDALSAAFTLYALDARGHGASAAEVDGFSVGAVADDVVAFAKVLGLSDALFIGHSFGGYVGLYGEVRHPGTFGAICMITAADAGSGEHKGNMDFANLMIEHGRNPEFMSQLLPAMYTRKPELAGRQAQALALMDPRVHQMYFEEYAKLSFIDQLAGVTCPILFVNGGQDGVVPLSAQHETALALSNCKEVNFMAEGHMFPVERGDVVAREVITFWTQDVSGPMKRA
jgi:pimeloyl-ACP methyl ester carboxylesterase